MPRAPLSHEMGNVITRKRVREMAPAVGFYGKLPHLGDFVTRRLPPDFVRPWDLWLQESLGTSQAQLGDDWLGIYLTSPLWRFVLTAGIVGQSPWAGVLMPSVDRVGRYFPLTLACPLADGVNPLLLLGKTDWFEGLEAVMLSGLEESSSLLAFDTRVLGLEEPPTTQLPAWQRNTTVPTRSNAWRVPAASPAALEGHCAFLLSLALEQVFCAFSLWWTNGSERVPPSGLICQGLPPPDGFSALLAGNWGESGWRDFAPQPPSTPAETAG